jgi:two-component sensor histidine kinase
LSLGADLFLKKPMEPDTFLAEIEKMISKMQEGSYNPRSIELKNDKDIYKIYNERLVNKLESKIEQLEKEIEKRKNTEMKLQKMISEKEILLRELYHRTKNNIQVISSMLRLKARLTENENVKEVFTEIENKILGIALIHQKLFETEDLSYLFLKDYLKSLIVLLRQNLLKPSDNVDISVKGDEIKILLDTAMPIGIIVNELISNSLKYAFPKNTRGRIEISLRSTEDNKIQLRICDNGVGLPEGFDIIRDGKLGLQTVYDLVNYQMAGEIRLENKNGLCCIITVGKELYSSRV